MQACLTYVPNSFNYLYYNALQYAVVVLFIVSQVQCVDNLEVKVTSSNNITVKVVPVYNLDNIAFNPSITGTIITNKYQFLYNALIIIAYFIYNQVN